MTTALVSTVRHQACSVTRGVEVAVVLDLIHVLEYLWGAVRCFFAEADPAAQKWVHDRALAVLAGNAREVAAGIRRRATMARLNKPKRIKADACAKYLTNKADYLDDPRALADYWNYHLTNERHRVHELRYPDPTPPMAA